MLEYRKRNLNGYSADPLLVDPTHFDGENNYISDTGGCMTSLLCVFTRADWQNKLMILFWLCKQLTYIQSM